MEEGFGENREGTSLSSESPGGRPVPDPTSDLSRRNKTYDLVRMLLAIGVILSHAFAITDGNAGREPLNFIFRSGDTLGMYCLDGFFLLSGYLNLKSCLRSSSISYFIVKRFLRIVPGYLVAAVLSVIVLGFVAPGQANFFHTLWPGFLFSLWRLGDPWTPPVLPGQAYPFVNGSLWTISFEIICYLVLVALSFIGIAKNRAAWLSLTCLLWVTFTFPFVAAVTNRMTHHNVIVHHFQFIRLAMFFLAGGCFQHFQDLIPYRASIAVSASLVLLACCFSHSTAQPSLVVLGGYLLFYLGSMRLAPQWFRSLPDISYGIYLYGWPIEAVIVWLFHPSPWLVFLGSLLLASLCGLGSWNAVERPAIRFGKILARNSSDISEISMPV